MIASRSRARSSTSTLVTKDVTASAEGGSLTRFLYPPTPDSTRATVDPTPAVERRPNIPRGYGSRRGTWSMYDPYHARRAVGAAGVPPDQSSRDGPLAGGILLALPRRSARPRRPRCRCP